MQDLSNLDFGIRIAEFGSEKRNCGYMIHRTADAESLEFGMAECGIRIDKSVV
jgi:hypothetical protein